MREWLVLGAVVLTLLTIHLVATATHGFALPETLRHRVGASAETVWSRFYAHFTAPFFHDGLFHLAYNSVLFAIGLPIVFRAYGPKALTWGYLASPIAGITVDVLILLPLAKAGSVSAQEIARTRLVGASVVAFALIGMALASVSPKLGWIALAIGAGVIAYELALATAGLTRPFIWAYHLTGFAVGITTAVLVARVPTFTGS